MSLSRIETTEYLQTFLLLICRQWSKKYPICIILSDKEKIQVLEKESSTAEKKATEATPSEKKKEPQQPQHEMETETSTSPEKKRKFVWRRRDKRFVVHLYITYYIYVWESHASVRPEYHGLIENPRETALASYFVV